MGIDGKFGRVTTELKDVGEDEPVFVIRARDRLARGTLRHYLFSCIETRCSQAQISGVRGAIAEFELWQQENPTRLPTREENR